MFETAQSRHRIRLGGLFFLQAHAQALWYVPLSNILQAHGLDWLTPYAFACNAAAALVSPLVGGVLADEHVAAERLLGWLSLGVSVLLALVFLAIQQSWGGGWVLVLLLAEQFLFAPVSSLIAAIVMASLQHPEREFGPIRVWGTYGWMLAGPLLSYVLQADASPVAGYLAAAAYLAVALFTLSLPSTPRTAGAGPRPWRELLGRDTLGLLRQADVRVVFFTSALFSMPLAAFYPFAPLCLRDAGGAQASAAMSLGQVTEVIATYALAPLLARVPLKWILCAGLAFGVVRYELFAVNARLFILSGILLHGFCYTLFFVTSQIFLERRIPAQFRTRAQALLTLMMLGVGNLFGSLGCGWLRQWCTGANGTDWGLFWNILAGVTAVVLVYFALYFRSAAPTAGDATPGALPVVPITAE